jgi:filamentous hemagglutinin family protein
MKKYSLNHSVTATQIIRRRALYLAIMSVLYPSFSVAAPSGAQIVSGQVSIDQSVSGVTTIKNSPNAIINWQNFNIAKNEITQFIQQNGQSAVLNRIVGGNPSEILGSLFSNGKVFLINPNGIVFGAGSQVDTQGLLASSLNLSDNDFQKGNFHFIAGSKAGDISNEGIIHAGKDGNIVLIAPNIENNGIIKSEGGKIVLAAGQELILTSMDDPDIRFQVQAPKNHVLNVGQLLTEGGSINVFAGSIKHSGDISADSVEIDKQGNIRLVAKGDVTLEKDSTISANNAKGVAGKIEVTGENVAVLDNSKLSATGEKGGGEILVGGDYQGKNAAVQNAKTTTIAEKVEIKADAKVEGKGGKVIVWSDNETKVAAKISAKGGAKSGDGGLVETSGKKLKIEKTINVDTTAKKGKTGKWLLDPVDVDVDASLASTLSTSLLTTTADVTASNNITVSSPVSWAANLLTLSAGNNLTINAAMDGGAAGQLAMNYSGTYSVNAPITLTEGNNLTVNGVPYYVITALGDAGDDCVNSLQGISCSDGMSGNFALGANIDATDTATWNNNGTLNQGFKPIGDNTTKFTGKFDGLGNTISNLTINRPTTSYVGLFGYVNGLIQNIGLLNSNITGGFSVGGLAGSTASPTWNSNTQSFDSISTISNSYVKGTITGDSHVGGLVGLNYGIITNSYSTANVSGFNNLGGLVGFNNGNMTNSHYDIENVLIKGGHYLTEGGLYTTQYQNWLANKSLDIANYTTPLPSVSGYYEISDTQGLKDMLGFVDNTSYKFKLANDIDLSTLPDWHIPAFYGAEFNGANHVLSNLSISQSFNLGIGFIGRIANTFNIPTPQTVTNLGLVNVNVAGSQWVGGLAGYGGGNGNVTISNSYVTGTITGNNDVGGLVGNSANGILVNSHYDIDNVLINNGSYVSQGGIYHAQYLDWFENKTLAITNYGTTLPSVNGYYEISSLQGLKDLLGFVDNSSYKFKLTTDLDLSSLAGWYIPKFKANEFDGNNHVLSNLSVQTRNFNTGTGFIGNLVSGSTLQNIGLENVSVVSSVGAGMLGGLVGQNSSGGIIRNSYSTGVVGYITNNSSVNEIGGLVGRNAGTIDNSYSTVSVNGSSNSNQLGGLVGSNSGTITNSYSVGAVTGTGSSLGGLVGNLQSGTVSNSYWNKTVNPTLTDDGRGLTTAEMKNAASFTGFDFASGSPVWSIVEGESYPYLTSNPLINRPSILGWGGTSCSVGGNCFYPTDTTNPYNWNTALNWNTGTIPNSDSYVYLSGFTGTVNYTDLSSSIAALTVDAGVGLTLSSTSTATALNIGGTSLINGTLNVNNSTFSPDSSGITGTGSIRYSGTGDFALPAITANTVNLNQSSGYVTQTAPISASSLVLSGDGVYTLSNSGNAIGTLAATGISSLSLLNSSALTIGSVNGVNGVNATGAIAIATNVGNLTITQPISTTDTSSNAIVLNAGSSKLAGDKTGGEIGFSATPPAMSTGTNGRVTFYSGHADNSSLASYVPAGNFRYNNVGIAPDATPGIYAIYREQPTITVSANPATKTYDGTDYSGGNGVTKTGFVNGDSDSILSGTINYSGLSQGAKDAGSYAITPSGLANGLGYALAYTDGVLTITPASLTVTANARSKIYGASDPTLTYSANGLIGSDSLSGSLSRLAGETVGTYAIGQGTLANSNYTVSYIPADFTITAAALALAIKASDKTRLYGAANPTFTGTIASGSLQNGDTLDSIGLTFSTDATSSSNVGNYQIIPSLNNQNYVFTGTNGVLSVTPASLIVTANALSKIYGATDPTLTYSVSGLVNSDSNPLTGALSRASGENVGTYAITQGNLANSNTNYSMTYTGADFGVSPASLTVTANALSKTYGTIDPTLTYSANGLIGSDTLSGSLSRDSGENVGSYGITKGSLANTNYNIAYTGATLGISPANLTVTANALSKTYGTIDPTLTYSTSGLIGSDTLSGSLSRDSGENVGSYGITKGSLANTNYNIAYTGATLGISPASLTVTANALSKIYGTIDPTLTYSTSGLIGSDTLSGNLSRDSGENVGSYGITKGSLANTNYNIAYTGATLGISPASLTVTANALSKIYGTTDPTLTYSTNGLIGSDTLSGSLSRDSGENVGSYGITKGSLANTNYNIAYTGATLGISPASLTVTANALSKIYGTIDPTLTYSTSGLIGSDTLSGSLSRLAGETVGKYTISSTLTNSNYAVNYVPADFTIDAVPLNLAIQAANQTRLYGAANPTFTGTIALGSLQNGDTLDSIGLTFSTDATSSSNVGDYQIIPALNNQNYIFTGKNGVLSVTPASLTIKGLTASNKDFDGTKTATLTGGELIGLVNGDTISLNSESKGEFSDSKVGTAKAITVSNIGLTGAAVNNYKVEMPTGLTADINRVTNIAWLGTTNNKWISADNWDQGVLPDATQDVKIPATNFSYIDISGNQEVKSLTSLSSLHLADASSIKINTNFTLFNKTSLSGNGTVTTNLFTNEGLIKPGNSPGSISIMGDYVQTDRGELEMEIKNESSTGYDRLNISGNAKLGGTIKFVAINGYQPSPTFQPDFLQAKSYESAFKNVDSSESPQLDYKFNANGTVTPATSALKEEAKQPITSVISTLMIQNQTSPQNSVSGQSASSAEDKKKERDTVIVEANAKITATKSTKPLGVCQ